MYSKYERRTDTRTYEDRKKLYEGGWEVIRAETLDAPSTRGGQTRGPTRTGRSSTKVAGRSSGQRPWMLLGRRSTTSGPSALPRSSPSGSARGQARRLAIPRPQRVRRKLEVTRPEPRRKRRRSMTRKRRRRRRSKLKLNSRLRAFDCENIPA